MKKRTGRMVLALALFAGFMIPAFLAYAGAIANGTVMGIDFGVADGSAAADNWNVVSTTASGSFTAGTMVDTSGVAVADVGFSWTAATIDSDAPDLMAGTPSFPSNALDDALLARDGYTDGDGGTCDGTFTLTFSGLDTNLAYNITLGSANDSGNGNTDTAWTIGGTTLDATPAEDGASAYVTFSNVSSSAGTIVITSAPIDGGLDISAVSALQLTAGAGTTTSAPPASVAFTNGMVIGVDFCGDGGAAANWNTLSSLNADVAAGSLTDTHGVVLTGVAFSTSGADGQNDNTSVSASHPSVPDNAQQDWWYDSTGSPFAFTFSGLDDSFTYDVLIGAYSPGVADAVLENRNTGWTADDQDMGTLASNAALSYVTLTNLATDGLGNLLVGTYNLNGNAVSGVSALQLTATTNSPWVKPLPEPVVLPAGIAALFDPTDSDSGVTAYDLDRMTGGGTWSNSISGVSRFDDNTGGYLYVMDAASAQGDYMELTLDNGGLGFSGSEVSIGFQMLATRASAASDKHTTLTGYDGTNDIFRLKVVSNTDNTLNTITATSGDGDESMGFTPLQNVVENAGYPSGLQDFRIVLSGGQVAFSGSSLVAQDGPVLHAAQTLTSLRWEITGSSTANQGFWLDEVEIRDGMLESPRAATDRPNVIFILCDDMGYKDVSCYGATVVDTPNIDGLAAGGLQFTDFHTGANICSPSRAAFLTGAYPQRAGLPYGINENRESHWFLGLNPDEITLAEQFRNQGYKNLMIGKWHLGSEEKFSYYNQGFDHYYGADSNLGHNPRFMDETKQIYSNTPQALMSSLYTQRVREYIRTYRNQPFVLYYAHNYPHTPYTEGNAFDGATGNGTRADVIKEIDWSIGQLVAELEANGILDNTLIVFSSDNGATANPYCLPWRGTKFVTYEGGHRVPFILYWKGQILTPAVLDTQVRAMDLFPTLCELIGEPMPTDRVYDGVSLVPLLGGGSITRDADDLPFYYYNNENLQAVREGDWKLHVPRTAEERPFWDQQGASTIYRLYNLASDPGESTDVSASNPDVVSNLAALAEGIEPLFGAYMERGSEQRATGTLFPEVPIFQNLSDWNSLLTDAEKGRGRTRFNRNGVVSMGRDYLDATTLPFGWQYFESPAPTDGAELPLTSNTVVGTQGNSGFAGTGSAALIGSASTGTFVVDSANTANAGVVRTDLLVVPEDYVIVRYTINEEDVSAGKSRATISGSFRDLVGGTADGSITAQVFHNGTELFSATGSSGRLLQADGTFDLHGVPVAEGDTVSFVVGSNGDSTGDETALRASISFAVSTDPADHAAIFESGAFFGDGTATLRFSGTPGKPYYIEQASDLTDSNSWAVVDAIPYLSPSPFSVNVDASQDLGFWRVVLDE